MNNINFETNCKNCGAPLEHKPYETIVKCNYCGSEYHRDRFGRFEENYINIEIMGKTRRFYIASISCEPNYDSFRTMDGYMHTVVVGEPNIEINLISC